MQGDAPSITSAQSYTNASVLTSSTLVVFLVFKIELMYTLHLECQSNHYVPIPLKWRPVLLPCCALKHVENLV